MTFAFFNLKFAIVLGALAAFGSLPFTIGFLRDYEVLLSSLTAYGVSTVVCVAISLRSNERFDFDLLAERVTSRSEEHTSELQSLMRISSAVFCLTNKYY